MKHIFTATFVLLFVFQCYGQGDRVVVSFTSVNAYGNNLYIDNMSIGTQFSVDVAVLSINNVKADTSYAIGTASHVTAPKVTVVNLGLTNISTPFSVTFTSTPGGYTSTKTVSSLNKGQVQEVTFDILTIPVSTQMNFQVLANVAGDENRSNDTLRQYTLIFPGTRRKVLFEEWTSSTCAPCAANNPTIDAFIQGRFDSLVAIKYHVGWPSPGNDPMYLHNPTQAYDRRYYYGVNAVPHLIMDGTVNPTYPYSTPTSLPDAYGTAARVGSPLSLTVTDARLTNDTVQATVALTVLSPLRAGNYRLRVHAVERKVRYASPPGTNGESVFSDVFRRAYPTSEGTVISGSLGTQTFVFKYKRDTAVWVDSMLYTVAFVQNDATREVVNCAKARSALAAASSTTPPDHPTASGRERCVSTELFSRTHIGVNTTANPPAGVFRYELFESSFPPPGWRLVNRDNAITWAPYTGISGPSFGGTTALKMDFYGYGTIGQTDTLYSPALTGLNGTDSLKFDWAYAPYQTENDRLIVKLSTDGGVTFPHTVFDRMGATLATAPATTSAFVPTGSSQWRTFSYSLGTILTEIDGHVGVPPAFALDHNYPNPFNPATMITYALPKAAHVQLEVLDILGRTIAILHNRMQQAGTHRVSFNAASYPSGIYFYRIRTEEFTTTRRMMLIR